MDEDVETRDESLDFFTQDGEALFADAAPVRDVPDTQDEPLALYRRYRPEVFSQIIGQEHVTEPLKRALAHNRVNHAYLFSGPRGCGKTSSARILARSLNCERGPTPEPCGVCQSCRDLARGGPGSIDVIEIDAASHGGVDDARDLRERAFFAPVHSRYKIYIVDEAHMVSPQGFNALLKLVEEPPPHVKFIFATTEPDKVIGTIRSRTHHYPFRLIPPKTMTTYLTQICDEEHMSVAPGVIPMVVRAGGGSVRDSLSILDQLFSGADDDGVGYAQAASLLGYTPDSLLDAVVDAIAASDASGVFSSIDKVIETGQDPRRFAEDLLTRLRDLVIVAAVPDALSSGLLDVPGDQAERFLVQAQAIGVGSLTRAAEVLAAGLVAMRGTTTPRLQLELMCARILLPTADTGERGFHARLERVERRLAVADQGTSTAVPAGSATAAVPATAIPTADAVATPVKSAVVTPVETPRGANRGVDEPATPLSAPPTARGAQSGGSEPETPRLAPRPVSTDDRPASTPDSQPPARAARVATGDRPLSESVSRTVSPEPPTSPVPPPSRPAGPLTTDDVRRSWPAVLARVSSSRRYLWMILNQYATVTELRGTVLWLTFRDSGSRDNFNRSGGEEQVAQAFFGELGVTLAVRARLESEPIPPEGQTAILSLAKPVAEVRPSTPDEPSAVPDLAVVPSAKTPKETSAAEPAEAEADEPAVEPPAEPVLEPAPAPGPAKPRTRRTAEKPTPPPVEVPPAEDPTDDEPDVPSADDVIVENPADQAEELMIELFDAELVSQEETKHVRPRTKR